MKKITYLFSFFCLVVLMSCVSRQKYNEVNEQLSYYKGEALGADSVNVSNLNLNNESQQLEAELFRKNTELEEMKATNIGLNRSYQDLLGRYNRLVSTSQYALAESSQDQVALRQEASTREIELDKKARELEQMEYRLQSREDQLRRMEANSPNSYAEKGGGIGQDRATMIAEAKAERMDRLRYTLIQRFANYDQQNMIIDQSDNEILVSINPNLIFARNSDVVTQQGQGIIQQITTIINQYADIHTSINDTGRDFGVNRGIAMVNTLLNFGLPATKVRLSAEALRSVQQPGVPSRVELILSPSFEDLYQALNR